MEPGDGGGGKGGEITSIKRNSIYQIRLASKFSSPATKKAFSIQNEAR
jgi:hypothetical protein